MTTARRRTALAFLASLLLAPVAGLHAEPPGKRMQFIYVLRIAPGFQEAGAWTEREAVVVKRHFERLAVAATQGKVILAGRTTEPLPTTFGVVIFEADNEGAARQFMEADPAVGSGLMTASLHPYTVALQRKP